MILEQLYQVDVKYACAGIAVSEGKVIAAAPIFLWTIGKKWSVVVAWINGKHGVIRPCLEQGATAK